MERFVRYVVVGGVALVAGLWLERLSAVGTVPWGIGALLALCGVAGLTAGIRREIRY